MTQPGEKAEENGNVWNPFTGLPKWARSVVFVGVIPGLCIYLVVRLTESIAAEVINTRTDMATVLMKVDTHLNDTKLLVALQRQICINTAQSDSQRDRCLQ